MFHNYVPDHNGNYHVQFVSDETRSLNENRLGLLRRCHIALNLERQTVYTVDKCSKIECD